ncbi:MAG: DUF1592 domain-containing protein, partial [Pirellulaceae bacterium]|nr:DUF1592 domain-containing protein [Pirellulaceae bacterium]
MLAQVFSNRSCVLVALAFACLVASVSRADDFDEFLKPLITKNCTRCHGGDEINGDVDLKQIATRAQLLGKPKLIQEVMEVIDANDMPPVDEPQLDDPTRAKLLTTLKTMLRDATSGETARQLQIRRLNRFQYNNSVKDLFRLKLDVFVLPEKLMTRHQNYLSAATGKMPDRVEVASNSLKPAPGLRGVKSFPKDLRAANGFDNQANQLTLSPLLLDAFLRLSVSIVESPDFNESNVGIWDEFFKQPAAGVDARAQIKPRLASFLYVAFRGPVEAATLERYTAYAAAKMDEGLSFTDSMRKVASAALCSPMFLFRSDSANSSDDQFELASNLSYFLWGSCPDVELLRLAETGELANPDTLDKTIERMFADPRIERFLDTFPGQWLQLENVLAATPDPQKFRLFSLDESNPASLQMLIEPLLLFDAVFIEDRPIVELIAPRFSYQSDFLQRWYASDLQPPRVDAGKILEANRLNDQRRNAQRATIKTTRAELDKLIAPIRARLLEAKKKDAAGEEPVDLKP